jgi:hypothetical protein
VHSEFGLLARYHFVFASGDLIVRFRQQLFVALLLLGLIGASASVVVAQSSDQGLPTAVLTSEINGRIPALDLGDPRLTRHYYAFEGTPGDLLITIDSKNLNGDMDVFTAVTFRPLIKTTIYANSQSGGVAKGIYLRTRQILILRIEARTPNDEAGTYHIRFGGTFAPFSGGIPVAENTEPQDDSTRPNRDGKRLSSVGATIPEPVVETPPSTSETKAPETEKAAPDTATVKKPVRPARPAGRNSRGRARPAPKPATPDTKTAKTSGEKTEAAKPDEAKQEEKPETSTSEKTEAAKPSTQELPLAGAHLIIESKDGTKIDRPMSTVRRVVVEGGTIVVVLKTGKIERIPMATVTRMAIEP